MTADDRNFHDFHTPCWRASLVRIYWKVRPMHLQSHRRGECHQPKPTILWVTSYLFNYFLWKIKWKIYINRKLYFQLVSPKVSLPNDAGKFDGISIEYDFFSCYPNWITIFGNAEKHSTASFINTILLVESINIPMKSPSAHVCIKINSITNFIHSMGNNYV